MTAVLAFCAYNAAELSGGSPPLATSIVTVRPDCSAAERVGGIVSALDSGHFGVLGGSADEAALDG